MHRVFPMEDTAQMECNSALQDIIIRNMAAQSELSRLLLENEQFDSFLTDRCIWSSISYGE